MVSPLYNLKKLISANRNISLLQERSQYKDRQLLFDQGQSDS